MCSPFDLTAGNTNGVSCNINAPLAFAILDSGEVSLSATASTTFNNVAANAVPEGQPIVLLLGVYRSVHVQKHVTELSYKAAGEPMQPPAHPATPHFPKGAWLESCMLRSPRMSFALLILQVLFAICNSYYECMYAGVAVL
jgi:hypothetical protein